MTDHMVKPESFDLLSKEKKQVRSELIALRDGIPQSERGALSLAACHRLLSMLDYRKAKTVLLYAPIRSELDVWSVFEAALADGKTVGLPRCGSGSLMEFYRVESHGDLVKGAYGIPEPSEDCPLLARESLFEMGGDAVCVVPGVAFDKSGYRMGYGGGYYDRYLADFKGIRIGITYTALLRDKIPTGAYDLQMNFVVTDAEILYF